MRPPFPAIRRAVVLLAVLAAVAPARAANKLPDWAEEAIAAPLPTYPDDVETVTLLDDSEREIDERGRIRTRYRGAFKIVRQGGRNSCTLYYQQGDDKVRSFEAWLLQPNGDIIRYKKRDVYDREVDSTGSLYSDSRKQYISASGDTKVGSILVWEYVLDERTLFAEDRWFFRVGDPVLYSRLRLTLPAGWELDALPLNQAQYSESRQGQTWTWEQRMIDPILVEDWMPPRGTLDTGVQLRLHPPAGARNEFVLFDSWNAVARYQANLSEGPASATPAVSAKALELTAGATSEWEKIKRLCEYAQGLKYVSISTNLGRGGGYTPHPAETILACGYGDCKDKVTLLRALLAAVGVESYYTAALSSEEGVVDPAWPSPSQFNHAIIAIRAPADADVATVVETEIGRLLVFDPTAEYTVMGDWPKSIQDSAVLVCQPQVHSLVDLPPLPASQNSRKESVTAVIDPDGLLHVSLSVVLAGQQATPWRAFSRNFSESEEREGYLRMLQDEASGAVLEEYSVTDDFGTGILRSQITFNHPAYVRNMRGRLLIFKPVIWDRRDWVPPESEIESRTNPVQINARGVDQTTTIELPEGFVIDERGEGLEIEDTFATYRLTYSLEGQTLTVVRTLDQKEMTLPASEFARVRAFYEKILQAENEPVVLMRTR